MPVVILLMLGMMLGASCDDGGSEATTGFVGDFTQESPGYIAANHSVSSDWLRTLFSPVTAYALPNLGISDEFTGTYPVPNDTLVNVLGPGGQFITFGHTDSFGHIEINDIPEGYINIHIVGGGGKTWLIPTHLTADKNTYMRALLMDNPQGKESVYAKSVHNSSGQPTNTDDFSIAIYGRQRNSFTGGIMIIHEDGETSIDSNGDGDFLDDDDRIITEPDDDGITSAQGDGDEDNDGITDNDEQGDNDDLDGDGFPNSSDMDDDGDGVPDVSDSTPRGITDLDDFVPPALIDPDGSFEGDAYTGIADVQPMWLDAEQTQPDLGKARVFFPGAEDEMNNDISYRIFYGTSALNFSTALYAVYHPTTGIITDPDELYDYQLTGLNAGETYWFAVRALDSAAPPNMDGNQDALNLELPTG